ncbi:MAG: hypothetical protein U0835_05640 [Isosphaeraceae bacterium]
MTSEPIVRDRARFDAAMNGPLGDAGLPADWQALRVNLKSARDAVTVSAGNQAGTVTASASASVPWKVLEREGQVGAKLAGRWKSRPEGALAEFDELALTIVPTDPALAAAGTLAFSAKGRLDLAADTLSLVPLPNAASAKAAAAFGPNGLMLKGVSKTPVERRSGRLSLAGDLAALDRALMVWTAGSEKGVGGPYTLDVAFTPDATGALNLGIGMVVTELTRAGSDGKSRTKEGPVSLSVVGNYRSAEDRLDLADLKFASRYGMLSGSGKVDEPAGRRLAELRGNLEPNWGMISALAAQSVEPNVRFEGGTRPFHVKGPLSAGSLAALLKGLDAEVGLDLASADVFGMRLGPAPIVVRCGGGNVTIDPIQTTLNGGRVDLKPGLDVDETRGIALTLAPGSSLKDVAVNDEVSRRVLRYIAPVLDKATHVNGRIAMNVEKADIPLSAPPDRRLTLTGQLVFQDVVFAPGPFAGEVLALAGRPDSAGLKLHQPVQFSVADGRVMQNGLEIPVNKDARVAFEGSVGFDETLDLRASVPITKGMLGQVAGLKDVVGDNRVTVPIGGTVTQPRINRQALQVALKELSSNMLKRGMTRQAQGLLDRIAPRPEGAAAEAGQDAPAAADPLQNLEDRLLKRLAPKPRPGGTRQP